MVDDDVVVVVVVVVVVGGGGGGVVGGGVVGGVVFVGGGGGEAGGVVFVVGDFVGVDFAGGCVTVVFPVFFLPRLVVERCSSSVVCPALASLPLPLPSFSSSLVFPLVSRWEVIALVGW